MSDTWNTEYDEEQYNEHQASRENLLRGGDDALFWFDEGDNDE